jgi:hypothetical protein
MGPLFNPLAPTLGGRQERSGDTPDPGSILLHLLVHSLFDKEGFQGVLGIGGHPQAPAGTWALHPAVGDRLPMKVRMRGWIRMAHGAYGAKTPV